MVEGFIKELESQIVPHLEEFYATHSVQFDIKSNENGAILYKGKKEDETDIWWQF
ncbi:hypothetical protein [Paenibacillus sp. CCS19]|uniref:hypothetical protein n=1 Tax=Paenibacillus sp. CCS19 TaxID=3158387 RepID=UPI00295F53D3|nr:hypothetical protein [Paenibacillus cellulosilyticus]